MRILDMASRSLLVLQLFAGVVLAQDGSIDAARDAILGESRDKSLLVIGEMHGSREAPALMAALGYHFAQAGPVLIGLEVPVQEQARLDAFLASNGDAAARRDVLAGTYWQVPRERSDGRRSEAMFGLLERVRVLRADGCAIRLMAFDDVDFYGAGRDRDALMAARLRELRLAHPDTTMLVLTGNYHARLVPPDHVIINDIRTDDVRKPMAGYLGDLGVVSINLRAHDGAAWACIAGSCGKKLLQTAISTEHDDGRVQSRRLDGPHAAYHVEVTLPRYTVSEPMAVD